MQSSRMKRRAFLIGTATASVAAVSSTGLRAEAATPSQALKLRDTVSVKDPAYGAKGDGVTLDNAAFALAAASGKTVRLTPGDTYVLSTRVKPVTGTHFICEGGFATIVCKTGPGGYNVRSLEVPKSGADRCLFWFDNVEDAGIEGVVFKPDGDTEVCIWPIQVSQGSNTRPVVFKRLIFENFPVATMITLNSIGASGYLLEDITGRNIGTAQGRSYWKGSVGAAVVGIDDDMVARTESKPGVMRNIRAYDVRLTGQALKEYGAQTDCITIGGIVNGSDVKGPQIFGVYADGVGEGIDCFGSHAVIKGVRLKNIQYYGVKLVHGAQLNVIELDTIESVGVAAVGIFGSSETTDHTKNNVVRVGTVTGVGTISGDGRSDAVAVLFGDNGGGAATCLPKNNFVRVENVLGDGAGLKYVVRDGAVDNSNGNVVEVGRASGWAKRFCDCVPSNERIRVHDSTRVRLTLNASQKVATATPTTIQFNSVQEDRKGEAVSASHKVRCKTPGLKQVYAQARMAGIRGGDDVVMRIKVNGTTVREASHDATSAKLAQTFPIQSVIYIAEDRADSSDADLSIEIEVRSAGAPQITASNALSFLEVTDLA